MFIYLPHYVWNTPVSILGSVFLSATTLFVFRVLVTLLGETFILQVVIPGVCRCRSVYFLVRLDAATGLIEHVVGQ